MNVRHSSSDPQPIVTPPLPDPIAQNIETILALHAQEAQNIPTHQRLLEQVAKFFGRPAFLYSVLGGLGIWILGPLINETHLFPFQIPTYRWLDQGLDTAALLISTGVLIRQTREENFAEQRSQLTLQLNLLSEQKIAKIVALLEELRADLPNVSDRYDPEAEVMQEAADPIEVLEVLQARLDHELVTTLSSEGSINPNSIDPSLSP